MRDKVSEIGYLPNALGYSGRSRLEQLEKSATSIILDNALLFSAANFFYRSKNSINVRSVNLLGLSALADALVMHDRLTVDRKGWDFLAESIPPQWLPSIQPMVDIIDFKFPTQESIVDAVFSNDNGTLLCYATTVLDNVIQSGNRNDLNALYFAYTNNDLGNVGLDESELISYISSYLPNIPDMHFYLRNSDHVSGLQCLVRAIQYEYFAAEIGRPYVPHEYRGRMLGILARSQADTSFATLWRDLMTSLKSRIKKEYQEELNWTSMSAAPAFWERLQMPLFLAMAMQKAKRFEDVFLEVERIREQARPVRRLLDDFTDPTIRDKSQLGNEIRSLMLEVAKSGPNHARSTVSLSFGLPASMSLAIDLPGRSKHPSVSFIRDIYDNYSVPYSLIGDVERLFPVPILPLTHDRIESSDPSKSLIEEMLGRFKEKGFM